MTLLCPFSPGNVDTATEGCEGGNAVISVKSGGKRMSNKWQQRSMSMQQDQPPGSTSTFLQMQKKLSLLKSGGPGLAIKFKILIGFW